MEPEKAVDTPTSSNMMAMDHRHHDSRENSRADNWLHVSDESFEEQERLCQSPVCNNIDYNLTHQLAISDEHTTTMLGDVAEPSCFWDDTIAATGLNNDSSTAAGRPATMLMRMRSHASIIIPEEECTTKNNNISSSNGGATAVSRPKKRDPLVAIKPDTPAINSSKTASLYRPSFFNVFPKRQAARKFLVHPEADQRSSSPSRGVLSVRNAAIPPEPVVSSSTGTDTWFKRQLCQQHSDDEHATKSKRQKLSSPAAARRNSLLLDQDDGDQQCDVDALNDALPHFNDTIEAMDYLMKDRQLDRSAAKSATPSPQHQQTKVGRTPKSASRRRMPDQIRRRMLVRNLMRSSEEAGQVVGSSGRAEDSFEWLE